MFYFFSLKIHIFGLMSITFTVYRPVRPLHIGAAVSGL